MRFFSYFQVSHLTSEKNVFKVQIGILLNEHSVVAAVH